MNEKFTVGQKVRLVNVAKSHPMLGEYVDKDLTVSHVGPFSISFEEDKAYGSHREGAWFSSRFAPVVQPVAAPKVNVSAPNNVLAHVGRGKGGRFESRTKEPVVLRNGSIYIVKRKRGLETARLKIVLKDKSSAVLSTAQGKLFFAKAEKLTLAPKSDVDTFLAATTKRE